MDLTPPVEAPAVLRPWMEAVTNAFALLATPQGPMPLWACTTTDMPAAADYPNHVLKNTTLDVLAVSNGTAWIRQDTGAAI